MIRYKTLISFLVLIILNSCNFNNEQKDMNVNSDIKIKNSNIIFLHHSVGKQVIQGGVSKYIYKITKTGNVHKWFKNYNKKHQTNYNFSDKIFPKSEPYGWKNYPYDYYNIWVKNAGNEPYVEEATLEILTEKYDLIIFKHCFPGAKIVEDSQADINSEKKTLENYKLQYLALKEKMLEFKDTKFLVWTNAALVKNGTNPEQAERTAEFHKWVMDEWDEKGDNIYLWDFYSLETEGSMYLKPENARNPNDSHISSTFAKRVYPLFCNRIIDVIQGRGDSGDITGRLK
jgi:hypothetical protein